MFGYNISLIDILIIVSLVGALFSPYECGAIAGAGLFLALLIIKLIHWFLTRNK